MFLDGLFRIIAPELWIKFCNLPDEALLEPAAATNGHSFHTENTFSEKIGVVSRLNGRIVNIKLK